MTLEPEALLPLTSTTTVSQAAALFAFDAVRASGQ
jgi:hypothetical protein